MLLHMQSACMLPAHLILVVVGAGILVLLLLLLCADFFRGWRREEFI